MVATAIAKATEYMGKRRIGALITLSKRQVWGLCRNGYSAKCKRIIGITH